MYIDKLILDPKISVKSLKGNWSHNAELLCRVNPIRCFIYSNLFDIDILNSIVRYYIRPKYIESDLINFNDKYSITGINKFYLFAFKFNYIYSYFSNLYKTKSTWEIAELLHLPQSTVYRLIDYYDGCDRSRYASNLQLEITAEIKLRYPNHVFEIEASFPPYRVDLFVKSKNLVIEIDYDWCHDNQYDSIRDEFLKLAYGLTVIRFKPEYMDISDLDSYL